MITKWYAPVIAACWNQAEGISVIAEEENGEAAFTAYFQHQPDVLIMNLSMPGMGGLEASRRILLKDKQAKILVFSVYENEVFLTRALDFGVLGYISNAVPHRQ